MKRLLGVGLSLLVVGSAGAMHKWGDYSNFTFSEEKKTVEETRELTPLERESAIKEKLEIIAYGSKNMTPAQRYLVLQATADLVCLEAPLLFSGFKYPECAIQFSEVNYTIMARMVAVILRNNFKLKQLEYSEMGASLSDFMVQEVEGDALLALDDELVRLSNAATNSGKTDKVFFPKVSAAVNAYFDDLLKNSDEKKTIEETREWTSLGRKSAIKEKLEIIANDSETMTPAQRYLVLHKAIADLVCLEAPLLFSGFTYPERNKFFSKVDYKIMARMVAVILRNNFELKQLEYPEMGALLADEDMVQEVANATEAYNSCMSGNALLDLDEKLVRLSDKKLTNDDFFQQVSEVVNAYFDGLLEKLTEKLK